MFEYIVCSTNININILCLKALHHPPEGIYIICPKALHHSLEGIYIIIPKALHRHHEGIYKSSPVDPTSPVRRYI